MTNWGGGNGNDTLTGGAGSDRFVFQSGLDLIVDFQNDFDTLVFHGSLFGPGELTVDQLLAGFARVVGETVVFRVGFDHVLTVEGVTSVEALRNDLEII